MISWFRDFVMASTTAKFWIGVWSLNLLSSILSRSLFGAVLSVVMIVVNLNWNRKQTPEQTA